MRRRGLCGSFEHNSIMAKVAMKPSTPYKVYGNGWQRISEAMPSCSSMTRSVAVSRLREKSLLDSVTT